MNNNLKEIIEKQTELYTKDLSPIIAVSQKLANTLAENITPIVQQQQKMIEALKPIVEQANNWQKMINPLAEATKKVFESIDYSYLRNQLSHITEIFKEIDFSQFDLIYKDISIKYLSNGFYPSFKCKKKTTIELVNCKNKKKIEKIICNAIESNIKTSKKELKYTFPECSRTINEIYKLYNEKKYRLCILSILNLVSYISNKNFENIDFADKKIRKKFIEINLTKEKESNYILFAPYIIDDDLIKNNVITRSFQDKPELYKKYPYNRNAIDHGYSMKFGSKTNCLRWFSVLFNTMEIIQKYEQIKDDIKQ